jgi:hypothetical protein
MLTIAVRDMRHYGRGRLGGAGARVPGAGAGGGGHPAAAILAGWSRAT